LPVAQVVDVTEQWRSWRQVLWLREEMIEDVVWSRGIVGSVAVVFFPSRRVSGVVQAGHRSLVIEGLTAPNLSRPIAMPDIISNSISVAIRVNPRVFSRRKHNLFPPSSGSRPTLARTLTFDLLAKSYFGLSRLAAPHVTLRGKGISSSAAAQVLNRIQTLVMGGGESVKAPKSWLGLVRPT